MAERSDTVLWHVPQSHYSEKVRWALDHKRVPHRRRTALGGTHPAATYVLTRGRHQTVPVLVLDGRAIGDSTAIIAALEERFPARPLYPADASGRRRALELEDWFDEHLGAAVRRWAYHVLAADRRALAEFARSQLPWAPGWAAGTAGPVVRRFLDLRFGIRDPTAAERAQRDVRAALDRLDAELDGRDWLCGDRLTVADVTAASLFYPLVLPPEGPYVPSHLPATWAELRDELAGRPGFQWVLAVYARHRAPAPA